MTCAICGMNRSEKEHKLNISGLEYRFSICNQCETEKVKEYDNFFDNIRENVKAEGT